MKTKKLALSFVLIASAAITSNAQQLPNSSFEEAWVDCVPWTSFNNTKTVGKTPTSWMISQVPGMSSGLGTAVVGEQNTNGHNGNAVKIYNFEAGAAGITRPVPGYLTLGTPWSTALAVITTPKRQDGGTFGGIEFTYQPDAVSFWYKDVRIDNQEKGGVSKCAPPSFYAQSPDFHKLGLCYYLKILYL